jgi:hypothetical protein
MQVLSAKNQEASSLLMPNSLAVSRVAAKAMHLAGLSLKITMEVMYTSGSCCKSLPQQITVLTHSASSSACTR